MFLDEAYSLGPRREDSDSFSKEAIDTLNQFLSENNKDFICIIAGYEKELDSCFFSKNPGLERRFPWKFRISAYSPSELYSIFVNQCEKESWILSWNEHNDILDLFTKNKELFTENGGDCKILLDKCKIAHAKRIFGVFNSEKFFLNKDDVLNGFETFKKLKNHKPKQDDPPFGMYF
jgi:hypothetical protein